MSTQLKGYKWEEVQQFVDNVQYCMQNLERGEIKDYALMFQWLYEKFKNWRPIEHKIKKIKKSRLDCMRRTWGYLWSAIKEEFDYQYEDSNYANLAAAFAGGIRTARH